MTDPLQTSSARAAAFTSLLLIAQQVVGKAARDTLFLSNFHTSHLPLAMASGALLSLGSVFWLARVMTRRPPDTLLPILFGLSAAGFGMEWALAFHAPRAASLLVYFQTAALGPASISTFWSFVNERFDPHAGKAAVARIAGGGALGGVLAGALTWRASTFIQPFTALLWLSVVNLGAVVSTLSTRAGWRAAPLVTPSSPAESDRRASSPLATLRSAPFLRNVGLLVALGAIISALLDYVFSVEATLRVGTGRPLLAFFSLFWLGVGLVSFLLQVLLGRVALEKLGLAINIAILPAIIVLGSALGLAVPGLASASILRGAEAVQRNTLFRSAYELLYAPVPDASKRATKLLIDIGCDRLGTITGSVVVFVTLHALAREHSSALLIVVVLLALLTLPLTARLHIGYVEALQQSLRESAAKLQEAAQPGTASGAPERSSLATEQEREDLIERVEALQPGGLSALVDAGGSASQPPLEAEEPPAGVALLTTARDIISQDRARVLRGLAELKPHDPAVPCAIQLLGDADLHQPALLALRVHAALITGLLLDALLDPSTDFTVRRRIPRALRSCSTQRAADGLLLGIADDRFEVRYECGRALLSVTDANPQITISTTQVAEVIRREVELSQHLDEQHNANTLLELDGESDEQHALVSDLVADRAHRSLEHLFTILSLVLEREPLRIAFKALHHQDAKYRGTALEYLYTVLPGEVRDLVWPYLGEAAPLTTARPANELLADLARATEPNAGPGLA